MIIVNSSKKFSVSAWECHSWKIPDISNSNSWVGFSSKDWAIWAFWPLISSLAFDCKHQIQNILVPPEKALLPLIPSTSNLCHPWSLCGNPKARIHCYMSLSPKPWWWLGTGWAQMAWYFLDLVCLSDDCHCQVWTKDLCGPLRFGHPSQVPTAGSWLVELSASVTLRATLDRRPTMLRIPSPQLGWAFPCAGSGELTSQREWSSCKKQSQDTNQVVILRRNRYPSAFLRAYPNTLWFSGWECGLRHHTDLLSNPALPVANSVILDATFHFSGLPVENNNDSNSAYFSGLCDRVLT